MDPSKSNRDLNELHPKVKALAEAFLAECKKQGINAAISETYRTVERQDYLYSLGRTRSGNIVTNAKGSEMGSYHQWRLAFDAFNNVKGKEYDADILKKMGAIGIKLGLEWGGNWSRFKDSPHFQYTFGLSIADLKAGKRPPTEVINPTPPVTTAPPVITAPPVNPTPTIDKEYQEAVNLLKQKGIITTVEAWYPQANTQYVEQLIANMMPQLMKEIDYEYHIKILNLIGILNSPEVWLNKQYKEDYVEILIKKVAALLK